MLALRLDVYFNSQSGPLVYSSVPSLLGKGCFIELMVQVDKWRGNAGGWRSCSIVKGKWSTIYC